MKITMEEKETRIDPFVLLVDEERFRVINGMIESAFSDRHFPHFIEHENLKKALDEFMKDFSVASHQRGWCRDPNCTFEK